jgi:hypothetical protein
LYERLTGCGTSAEDATIGTGECSSPQFVQDILRQAEAVVGKVIPDAATHVQLVNVLAEIKDFERGNGVASKVTGLFSFVNFIWLVSILGITVSIGPSLYLMLKPVQELLRLIVERIFFDIIIPIAKRLHNWGVVEAVVFALCFLGVAQGFRMEEGQDSSVLVAFTGSVLVVPCFAYSTLLWGGRLAKSTQPETLTQIVQIWLALCWAPLAVHFSSHLFGFLAVAAFFGALGFGVVCRGCCYYIGFDDRDGLQRGTVTGFMLLVLFVGVRVGLGFPPAWLAPFESPVAVMGSMVMLLGLLIVSNKWYSDHRNKGMPFFFYRGHTCQLRSNHHHHHSHHRGGGRRIKEGRKLKAGK